MGIVDRYVLRSFARVFLICFLSLVGVYVMADFVDHLTEFVDHARDGESLLAVVAGYYGAHLPWFFDLTSRVVVLISAVFVVTWMQRHHEMTALMAAGISRARIVAPLILAALLVSLLSAANREITIPSLRDRLCRDARDLANSGGSPMHPAYDTATEIWIRGKQTHASQRRISKPNFRLPPQLAAFGPRILAESAEYHDATVDRPGGYLLHGVTEPEDVNERLTVSIAERTIVFSPHDTEWLGEKQCFVATDITVEHLESGSDLYQYSSTLQLLKKLRSRSLDFASDVRVLIHARLVQPLLDMTLFFMGFPLILARESRNVFVSIGLCVLIVVGFSIVVLGCQALGMNYLISPTLAAWCPLMVFVPCAVYLSEPLRR